MSFSRARLSLSHCLGLLELLFLLCGTRDGRPVIVVKYAHGGLHTKGNSQLQKCRSIGIQTSLLWGHSFIRHHRPLKDGTPYRQPPKASILQSSAAGFTNFSQRFSLPLPFSLSPICSLKRRLSSNRLPASHTNFLSSALVCPSPFSLSPTHAMQRPINIMLTTFICTGWRK